MNPDENLSADAAPDIEAGLERLYNTIEPDASFANRLDVRLSKLPRPQGGRLASLARFGTAAGSAWRFAAGLAALGLVAVVIVFGIRLLPERSVASSAESQAPAPVGAATLTVQPATQPAIQSVTQPVSTPNPALALPAKLVPGACNLPLSAFSETDILQPETRPETLLGGGAVQNGNFTFHLWLVCDSKYARSQPGGDYFSEVDGLGLMIVWQYKGPAMDGEILDFAGFESYVRESSMTAPTANNPSTMRQHGIQFPVGILPDFSRAETNLRYVVKAQTPDGVLAGAALSFVLQREADGYRPVQVRVDPLPAQELLVAESDPAATPAFPTLDPLQVYPQLQELRALLDRWQETLRSSPGWVHLMMHNTSSGRSDLYPGVTDHTLDEWYLLDENGFVTQSVSIDRAPDGSILQQSYSKDRQSYNPTFGERNSYTPYRFDMGSGLYTLAFSLLHSGESLERSEIMVDGKPAWLFQVADTFSETVTIGDVPAAAMVWREAIDPESGALLYSEQWLTAPDGTQQLIGRSVYAVVERVNLPPQEALDLLSQPPAPYAPQPPLGTTPPADFDPSSVDLSMQTVGGDSFTRPSFWYGDLRAGDYWLGRVDFGAVPGGQCDRSADGRWLAFSYDTVSSDTQTSSRLRWLDLRNAATVYGSASTESTSPDVTGLTLHSPIAWSPFGRQLAFFACGADGLCGLYILDVDIGSLRLAPNTELSFQMPVWKWDASEIAWLALGVNDQEVKVVRVSDGSLIYSGALKDAPSALWWVDFPEGLSTFGRCEHPKGKPLQIQTYNLRQEGESVAVDMCFVPPDASDWYISYATLQYGEQQALIDESSYLEAPSELANSGLAYRCQSLLFPASGWNAQIPTTLFIHGLVAYPREGTECAWYTDVVQPALDARQSGIRIACTQDHGARIEFLQMPDGMSENEASRILYQVYIWTITFSGPWEFVLIQ